MMKKIVRRLLEGKVKKYLKKHKPLLVVVVGSVGKTTTKHAIATVLSEKYRVRAHAGNYNTHYSVPTAIMGVTYPSDPRSIAQWRAVFAAMNARIKGEKDVDVIVQELGVDAPGDMRQFSEYLFADIAVVTAVSEEHMEFFDSIESVAQEELSVASFAKLTVVNRDDVAERYAKYANTQQINTYGLGEKAEYRLVMEQASPLDGRIGQAITPEWGEVPVTSQLVGEHSLKAIIAAVAVAAKLGLTSRQVAIGVGNVKSVPGRMQVLRGVEGSTVIDDTYNSSPLAVSAALKTLYAIDAPQRIALLGSMNELGNTSAQAHEMAGMECDPNRLDWVVTIGEEAAKYLAPSAQKNGCQVKSFLSPYEAGGFVNSVIKPGAVVLVKGSQNGVFAEEAVKVLLHSTEDEARLVRQEQHWLSRKSAAFEYQVGED